MGAPRFAVAQRRGSHLARHVDRHLDRLLHLSASPRGHFELCARHRLCELRLVHEPQPRLRLRHRLCLSGMRLFLRLPQPRHGVLGFERSIASKYSLGCSQ